MIHLGRSGSRLGTFSEAEVRQGLATGRFFLTDLAWKEGMENWAPLSQFPELLSPPPLPDEPAEPAEPVEPQPAQPDGLPWDRRKEIGFFNAFGQTAGLVLLNPAAAFSRMLIESRLLGPLLYDIIGGWFGLVVAGIYQLVIAKSETPPATLSQVQALFYLSPEKAKLELVVVIILGPLFVIIGAFVSSGIAHLFLMLAGGANKPFHVTLRVFCFACGSTQLFQVFPVFGGLLGLVWMVACCIIGLAVAHQTTIGRSLAAMGLFLAACTACCVGAFFLALGTAGIQSMRPLLNQ